jgi:hypothetical protein
VLYAVALGPLVGLKVGISFLKMKRAARRGEKKFYRELRRSGLPKEEAKYLANEYGAGISVRNIISGFGGAIPLMAKKPGQ